MAGDTVGNAALAAHLIIAFVITIGGTLQLIPQIRAYAPAFHRWNGRLYIAIAFVASVAGIYMIWTRDTFGGILLNDIGVTLNGVSSSSRRSRCATRWRATSMCTSAGPCARSRW